MKLQAGEGEIKEDLGVSCARSMTDRKELPTLSRSTIMSRRTLIRMISPTLLLTSDL